MKFRFGILTGNIKAYFDEIVMIPLKKPGLFWQWEGGERQKGYFKKRKIGLIFYKEIGKNEWAKLLIKQKR